MAGPVLIDRARLERAVGAADVEAMADSDADVDLALQVASDVAWAKLRRGFTPEEILQVAAEDEDVRNAIALIAADALAKRRKEFRLADGSTIYGKDAATARKDLETKALGENRSVAEATADVEPAKLLNERPRPRRRSYVRGGGF